MHNRSVTLLFLNLIFISAPAIAENFTKIDLREPGFSMENIPVYNQESQPLCFSYAAAAMVDAYRQSHQEQQPKQAQASDHMTSPIAAAITSYREHNDFFLNLFGNEPIREGGGFICTTIRSIKKSGSCNDKVLPQTLNYYMAALLDKYENYLSSYKKIESLRDRSLETGGLSEDDILKLKNELSVRLKILLSDSLLTSKSKIFEKSPSRLLDYKNTMDFFWENLYDKCNSSPARIQVNIPQCLITRYPGKTIAIEMLDEQLLKKNPQPTGISYCAEMLEKGRAYKKDSNIFKSFSGEDDCGRHASLVIGRRVVSEGPNKSKLQFLIRNSWGNTCKPYSGLAPRLVEIRELSGDLFHATSSIA